MFLESNQTRTHILSSLTETSSVSPCQKERGVRATSTHPWSPENSASTTSSALLLRLHLRACSVSKHGRKGWPLRLSTRTSESFILGSTTSPALEVRTAFPQRPQIMPWQIDNHQPLLRRCSPFLFDGRQNLFPNATGHSLEHFFRFLEGLGPARATPVPVGDSRNLAGSRLWCPGTGGQRKEHRRQPAMSTCHTRLFTNREVAVCLGGHKTFSFLTGLTTATADLIPGQVLALRYYYL